MSFQPILERQNQVQRVLLQNKIIEVFGDFKPYLTGDGSIIPEWEKKILVPVDLPAPLPLVWQPEVKVKQSRCHKLIKPHLEAALNAAFKEPGVWETVNDFGGVYNFRIQRKTKEVLSRHCWGIAIDIDVGDNPYGANPKVHPKLWEIFRSYGFVWGGTFNKARRDGMHFEFADLRLL